MTFAASAVRVLLLGCLMLGGCAHYTVDQRAVLKPTPEPADAPPVVARLAALGVSGETRSITTDDGVKLHAVWIQRDPSRPTVIYFGGNMTIASNNAVYLVRQFGELPFNLLAVDHRGSGFSEGEPTIDRILQDSVVAYDYARHTLGIAPEQIVLHGFSMGSFMAGYASQHRPIAGLVLEGSATTTEEWVKSSVPWYFKPFVRIDVAQDMRGRGNRQVVETQTAPLLLMVGTADRQTPAVLTKRLAEAARSNGHKVEVLIVKNAAHGDVLNDAEGQRTYADWLKSLTSTQAAALPTS